MYTGYIHSTVVCVQGEVCSILCTGYSVQYSEPPWVEDGGSVGGEVWGLQDMAGQVGVWEGGGGVNRQL